MTASAPKTITITEWRSYEKNTLRGFFTVMLPSGLIIHDCTLHERGGERWISLPSREWKDAQGKRQFAAFLTFVDRETGDRFRDQVLAALDRYMEVRP
jgi:hypothetical protein